MVLNIQQRHLSLFVTQASQVFIFFMLCLKTE